MSSSFSAAGAKDRAESLFYKALDLPPGDRAAFLNEVCAQDANLRAEVDGYLLHYEQAGPFLKEDASASAELEAQLARLKPEEVGNRIGPYKLLEQIGEGGFGRVWVAEQEHPIRRRVALKIIKLGMDTKDVVARFEQERQALAMMDHPNIAKVFEAGATPFGRPFFVMELVRGVKITDYCDQTKLPTEERLRLFIAVCQAVQHAHQKGIIHRDLKPSNILVTLHDGVPVPKVIDFGVAKATQQQRLTDLTVYTQFEQMIGTPLYMSPEQAEMSGLDVDTRSDIYSLGVLLYELLIGKTPFDPERLMKAGYDEMRRVIREEEPQKPSTLLSTMAAEARTNVARHRDSEGAKLISSIKGDLDWIVMKALEKDRNRRYETASGLARDIERHLGSEPVLARPPSNLYRFRRFAKRNKVVFAASAAVLAMLVVGLGVSTWMFFQEKRARERAVAAEQEQGRLRQLSVAAEKAQSEERKKAESAASKSGQVAQFLTNMLKGVGPSVALGRDTRLLREILDKTAERVSKDLKDQPEVEADLRSIIGDVYFELGSYEQARAMHTEALAIRKKKLGNEHPGVAASLDAVAVALHLQGKFAEAEAMHREALAMQRKLLGNEHPSVTTSLNNLAQTLSKHGRFAEAEAMQREALAMQRKLLGNEHPSVATSLDNLAIALSKQGKLAEAETMSREGLAMQRKVRGSEHPEVAASLGNLATLLHGQNKLPEAEAMQREALAMQRKLLGSEHPDIAVSLGNLANVLHHQGKLAEAETMSREVLVMHRKLLGSEHPNVAGSLYNLASVLTKQGKLAEAETMNREGLGMLRKLLGNDHPDVAASLNDVAVVLHHQHKLAEAEATFREALALQRKLFGSEHPNVAVSLGNLANTLSQQGKLDEAETTFREVLVMQRKLFGSEHPSVGGSLNNLANVLSRKGKLIEAETMSREALVIARKSAKSPKDLEDSLQALAESLFRQRKYAEAEPLHRELVGSRQARLPAEDGGLTASIASLARLLADWAWSESGWISKAPTGSRAERDRLPQAAGTESAVTGSKSEISERAYEAERLLRECLASQLRSAKPNEWRADENRSRLGSALLAVAVTDATLTSEARQAKFAEAEALMLEANKALQQGDKIESKYKRDALTRIIRLYQTWNKPKQVADWERKLADFDKAAAKSASGEKSDSPRI